jgi:hypothetical protein
MPIPTLPTNTRVHTTGEDRRLDRTVATVLMIMESLDGFAHKYDYSIVVKLCSRMSL